MSLDLNLDNYDLPELLNLFKLDYDFNEDDLRRAKKIVLHTHPDKSPSLEKEYFLFFSEAYKILYGIYNFRNKNKNTTHNTEYYIEKDEDKELLFRDFRNKPNFNKRFNELFEQYRLKDMDVDGGYGDWLKSDEDIDMRTTTFSDMNETFQIKKKEIKALVKVDEIEEYYGGMGLYDLSRDKPECYSSGLFSSLGYEDLRKAHIESVIPVTHDDYLHRPKYRNIEELQRSSEYQNIAPVCWEQTKDFLDKKNYGESKNDVKRAFNLAKQDEESRKCREGLISHFNKLTMHVCNNNKSI